jgi:hypothetical protein
MKTAASSSNAEPTWYKFTHELSKAKEYLNLSTGKAQKLSSEHKILWSYCYSRHNYFVTQKGGVWHDNQSDIADACGVSERTVVRFIKEFAASGYITTTKIGRSNNYSIICDIKLVTTNKNTKEKTSLVKPFVQHDEYGDDYDPFTTEAETLPIVAAPKAFKAESVEAEEPNFIAAPPKPTKPIKQHKWAVSIDDVLGTSTKKAEPVIDDAPQWWDSDYNEMREPF